MTSSNASIIPITLTVNDQTGLTLWAPPWEDEDGDEWQGFLGDGKKILLYPTAAELAAFIASGEENDLSDHPGYGQVLKATPDQLKPGSEDHFDLDRVYEWAGGEPDPMHVSALADVVDMVAKIADCCDDGALRRLVEGTPAYADLVDEDITYQGKDGRKRWNELGDTIADSWERAIKRVAGWLEWVGDFEETEFDADDSLWERIGAEPIAIVVPDGTFLTMRGEVPVREEHTPGAGLGKSDADGDGDLDEDENDEEVEIVFLGDESSIQVFVETTDLARYCRTAEEHELHRLQWWSELADVEDDDVFEPADDAVYDLRKPSSRGAELLRDLAYFCDLDADTDVLDGPSIDKEDWRALVAEVRTCFEVQD